MHIDSREKERSVKIAPAVQQALDVFKETEQTKLAISTAIMAKQQDAVKQQGEAAVQLVQQAATMSRGIDIRA